MCFGGGWMALSSVLGLFSFSLINGIGIGLAITGMVIVIKTLSTIKQIELVFDEEEQ